MYEDAEVALLCRVTGAEIFIGLVIVEFVVLLLLLLFLLCEIAVGIDFELFGIGLLEGMVYCSVV